MNGFPLIAVIIDELKPFVVTMIDFDNQMVRRTIAQNGDGEWYSFEDVYLMENYDCNNGLENYLLNSDINYQNYEKVDGERTVFNNRFNAESVIEDKLRSALNERIAYLNKELSGIESEKKALHDRNFNINSEIDEVNKKLSQL